jgi:hypothetical protein
MRRWIALAMFTILGAATFASSAVAEEKFQKLTGARIRAKFAGMELTDQVHWSDVCILLGYAGGQPPAGTWLLVSRLGAAFYFLYFLVILPVLGFIERPRSPPTRISQPVLQTADPRARARHAGSNPIQSSDGDALIPSAS